MKELTYLHCQCQSYNSLANNFFCYLKSRKTATPCIFIVLEKQKDATIDLMKKLQKYNLMMYPIIITDVED